MVDCVGDRIHRLVAGVFLALVFAACPSTARSTPSAVCQLSQFNVLLGPRISEATGQHTLALRLVSRSAERCVLDGYPEVALYDDRGLIPFRIQNGGGQMVTHHRPVRFVVRAGGSAWVVLDNYRCDLGTKRAATSVRIATANSALRPLLLVSVVNPYRRLDYCGQGDPGSSLLSHRSNPRFERRSAAEPQMTVGCPSVAL